MKIDKNLHGVIVIEGHVQGLANTRALGEAGIPVIVISEYNCLARYSRYCKKYFKCPGYLSEEFIDFLINLALTLDIKGWVLLPSNDHAVYNISKHIESLEKYYKIISPEPSILETIYNKEQLIKLCQFIDVPVPLSWFPAVPEDVKNLDLKFPLLIKGKHGLSFYKKLGKKAFLIDGPASMKKVIQKVEEKAQFSNVYFQNLLPVERNKPISFTAFSISGKIKSYWIGLKIREHPLNFGTATYTRSIDNPILKELAEILLRNLRFTGVCEIEFLLYPRDNKYKLIEVNARTWLWVDLAIKNGINYPLMIYNYLNNIEMDYPRSYKVEGEWIHYLTDIPYSLLGIIRRQYSFREIINSYRKLPNPAVFKVSDILPFFAEIILLPFFFLKR